MPVSGNEEPGVKSVARQSSDSIAGIPIKKRRFPLVQPPSPPSQAQSPSPVENDSPQKEHSNLSQQSSLTDASVATSPSGLSDKMKNSFSEKKGAISVNNNLPRVKREEPSLTIYPGSLDEMDSKEKLMVAKKSTCQSVSGNTKLQLAPKETLVLNSGKEILNIQKYEGDSKSSTFLGNTELSLGLKEPVVLVSAGRNSEGSCQMQEKLDPISWNLSLTEKKSAPLCRSDGVESNIHGNYLHANRSNWDLNTTMDAWEEGSVSDMSAGQGTVGVDVLDATSGTQVNPLISSTRMLGAGVASGEQRLEESDPRSIFSILPMPLCQQYKSEDPLHLRLSPSYLQPKFSREHSSSPAIADSSVVHANSSLPRLMVPIVNLNMGGHRTVKSEPFDDSSKQEFKGTKANLIALLDCRTVKHESVERGGIEALKPLDFSSLNVGNCSFVKSEPVEGVGRGTPKTTGGTSHQSDGQVLQSLDTLEMPKTAEMACPSGLPTCSTELFINGDVSSHKENSNNPKEVHLNGEMLLETFESVEQIAAETVSTSVGPEVKESNASDGMMDTQGAADLNVDDTNESCRLKLMDELPLDSRGNGEGSVSDEEKINISALEEDSYGSDSESDVNQAFAATMDTEQYGGEDDDYEDGEVREPPVNNAIEGPICEKTEAEDGIRGDSDKKMMDMSGFIGDSQLSPPHVEEKDTEVEDHGETDNDHSKGCVNAVVDEKADQGVDKDACLPESSVSEMPTVEADKKRSVKATRRKPLDRSGARDVPKGQETELSFDQATNGSQGNPVTGIQGAEENSQGTDMVEKYDSALPHMEASLNGDDAAKDANSGANRSRIINLSRAIHVSPSNKTGYIPGRSFPSRTFRERFSDLVNEGDKLHPRGRDEIYNDGPHKFVRERNQDQSVRNPRLNFMRGRGRGSGRFNTLRGDWDSDRGFAPDLYNDSAEFRFPRHKHASAVADADNECNSYIIAPDDPVGPGRGGRKTLNDEMPIFRHPPSRRRSPGGREGPSTRGVQMVRRFPRNISPNRCIGEDGSELVGMRHSEKFIRGLPDEIIEPMFTRAQYEGVDGHFVRGNRNFSSLQGRGLPRIRSKSPIRSRTRSPGPWSSPRRRSPDGFNGHPGLTHRRSPAIYRMERMRSPDRPCFSGDIVARRHGSPHYLSRPSNDMRDRRSPPSRVIQRNSRRFDIIDPRERTDNDEFFGGHIHPGRFHELGGDGSGDERRRCGERRGPVRSFRLPYNGADGEDFRLEDGSRPFRFCPEDPEFHERGNLREREFDRRIKNRPGNVPRRIRSIEEQEGNYRHGGQVWHDDGFDDIRLKRRRI
ncbi:hypothetical protein L1049_011185 [Liquidambar formosana]|uniref:Uncharacterized protein n=1 Tax=Liquidambar formosana TaxID=63359 RepID=A0AAP0RRB0_LIQFO